MMARPQLPVVSQQFIRFGRAQFRPARLSLLLAGAYSALMVPVAANPVGGTVVAGTASITQNGSSLVVKNTPGTIINWRSFNIGSGETTNFIQQSVNSAILNRVIGVDPSSILGSLTSNGRVFLINPNGMVFGKGAMVDTAGLVLSTLNITDADFQAGRMRFVGSTAGTNGDLQIAGVVRSSDGDVYLIAPNIKNTGSITATNGSAVLAAGQSVDIVGKGFDDITFEVQNKGNSVQNLGQITGDAVGMFAGTITQAGGVQANAVSVGGGRVVLSAQGNIDFAGGSTTTAAHGADGGSISAVSSGGDLNVASGASIAASGVQGGTITLQAVTGTNSISGSVAATGTLSLADATPAHGGTVALLGNQVGLFDAASVDASGTNGGGTVLVGGDFQGKNAAIQNASAVYVGEGTSISANATDAGNGGKVVVFSTDSTKVGGSIEAMGGVNGGDGGSVETSGKQYLAVINAPEMNARSATGKGGSWLLDPTDITISNAPSSGGMSSSSPFQGTANASILNTTVLDGALNGGATVTVDTTSSATSLGNITVASPIVSAGSGTLNLHANNDIIINAGITASSTLNVNLVANQTNAAGVLGAISIDPGATITTQGGSFTATGGQFTNNDTIDTRNSAFGSGGAINVTVTLPSGATRTGAAITTGTMITDGSSYDAGGAGAVSLIADGAVVVGSISAQGGGSSFMAGAAGGTVSIQANGSITGGSINVNGGAGGQSNGTGLAGGDGGTITLTSTSGLPTDTISVPTLTAVGGVGGESDGLFNTNVFAGSGGRGGNINITSGGASVVLGVTSLSGGTGGISTDTNQTGGTAQYIYGGTGGTGGTITVIAPSVDVEGAVDVNGGTGGQAMAPVNGNFTVGGEGGFGGHVNFYNDSGTLTVGGTGSVTANGATGGSAASDSNGVIGGAGSGGYGGQINISSTSAVVLNASNLTLSANGANGGATLDTSGLAHANGSSGGGGGEIYVTAGGGDLTVTGGVFDALGGSGSPGTSYSGTGSISGGNGFYSAQGGEIQMIAEGNLTLNATTLDVSGGTGSAGGSTTGGTTATSTGAVGGGSGGSGGSGGQVYLFSSLDLMAINGVTINANGGNGGQGGSVTGPNQGAVSGGGGSGGWAGTINLSAGNGGITLAGSLSALAGNGGAAGTAVSAGSTSSGGDGGNATPFNQYPISLVAQSDITTSGTIVTGGGTGGNSNDVQGYVFNSGPINITANPGSGGAGGSSGQILIQSYNGQITSGATMSSVAGNGGNGGAILNPSALGGNQLTAGSGGNGGTAGAIVLSAQTGLTLNGDIEVTPGDGGATFFPAQGYSGTPGNGGNTGGIALVTNNGDLNLNANLLAYSSFEGVPYSYTYNSPEIFLAAYNGSVNQNSGSISNPSGGDLTLNASAGFTGNINLQSSSNNFDYFDADAGGNIYATSSAYSLFAGQNGGIEAGNNLNLTRISSPGSYGYLAVTNLSAGGYLTLSSDQLDVFSNSSLVGNQGVFVAPYNTGGNINIQPLSYSTGLYNDTSALELGSEFFNALQTPELYVGNANVNQIHILNPSGAGPITLGGGTQLVLNATTVSQDANAPLAVDSLLVIADSVSMTAPNVGSSGNLITLAGQTNSGNGSNFDFTAGAGQHVNVGQVINSSGIQGYTEITLTADTMSITAPIVTAGAPAVVTLEPYTTSETITLGGTGTGLSLLNSDLGNISTSGGLTIGSSSQSGQIAVVGAVDTSGTAAGPLQLLNGSGGITISGGSLNVASDVFLTTTGSITGGGGGSIAAPGTVYLSASDNVGGAAPLVVNASNVVLYAGGNASIATSGNYNSDQVLVTGNLTLSAASISEAGGTPFAVGGTTSLTTSGGGISLLNFSGNSFGGALSASNSGTGATIAINADGNLTLGPISSGTGALSISANGTIGQTGAVTQASGAPGASINSSGGDVDLTASGNTFRPGLSVVADGAIAVNNSIALNIANASSSSSGAVTLDAPQITVSGTIDGGVVQLAGTSGITVDGAITGSSSVNLTSSGGALAIGSTTSSANVSGGNIILTGTNITVTGSNAPAAATIISASGTLDINTSGNFTITAGANAAEVLSVGNATVQVGGALTLNGGTGTNAFALLDPAAPPPVPGNLIVYADSILLNGGSGNGAYAALQSQGNILLHSVNGIVLTPGSGTNADAVIVAPNGSVTYTGTCNACTPYASNPLLNSTSDSGIFSSAPVSAPATNPPPPLPPAPPPAATPDATAPPLTLNEIIQQLVTLWNEGGPNDIDNDLTAAIIVQGDPNDCR